MRRSLDILPLTPEEVRRLSGLRYDQLREQEDSAWQYTQQWHHILLSQLFAVKAIEERIVVVSTWCMMSNRLYSGERKWVMVKYKLTLVCNEKTRRNWVLPKPLCFLSKSTKAAGLKCPSSNVAIVSSVYGLSLSEHLFLSLRLFARFSAFSLQHLYLRYPLLIARTAASASLKFCDNPRVGIWACGSIFELLQVLDCQFNDSLWT